MHPSSVNVVESAAERVARLEARVEALERAVARLSVLAARPAAPHATKAATAAAPAAAAPMAEVPFTLDVCSADAPTQRLPVLATGGDSRATLDRLGITAAFATLDQHVAEATRSEAARARPAPISLSEIAIDESLIDKAFARPPPEKLDVVADIEALHPRIAERVTGTWRTPELLGYLRKLIVDERGDRAGFSPEVMSELLLLSAVLEAPDEPDAWNANARTM